MLSIDHFRRSIAWSEIWIPVDCDEQQPTSIALSIVTVKKFLRFHLQKALQIYQGLPSMHDGYLALLY